MQTGVVNAGLMRVEKLLMGAVSCLPRQGMLNLDASSVVNMIHSTDFTGWKPWSLRNFTALIAPITPSAPSYGPPSLTVSLCEPDITVPAVHA